MRAYSFLGAAVLSAMVFTTGATAQRVDRDFAVENRIGGTIRELYVSPSSVTQWGPDQLGENVLANGGSLTLHFSPRNYRGQCVFDIKLVESDGDESVVNGVNLCTITAVTFRRNAAGAVIYSTRNGG